MVQQAAAEDLLFMTSVLAPFLETAVHIRQAASSSTETNSTHSRASIQAVQYLHRAVHLPSRTAVMHALEAQIRGRKIAPATALHAIAPDLPILFDLDKVVMPEEPADR
jgi:hypothetical protein